MMFVLALALLLLLLSVVLPFGVLAGSARDAPIVFPQRNLTGLTPYYVIAAPLSVAPSVLLYATDNHGDLDTLYALGPDGRVVSQAAAPMALVYFETRPQGSVVWQLGQNGSSPSPQYLIGFSTSVPLTLLHVFHAPSTLRGNRFLATDSAGRIFVSDANLITVLDPTDGHLLTSFNLTNTDNLLAVTYDQGWYIGFDPSDTLWVLSGNYDSNGALGISRVTSAGVVLNAARIVLPNSNGSTLQSFAVDSAGVAYVTLYAQTAAAAVLYKIDSAFTVSTVALPSFTAPSPNDYDIIMSVTWGATFTSDRFYLYDFERQPLVVLNSDCALLPSVSTNPAGADLSLAITYDPFTDTMLATNQRETSYVVRVDAAGEVVQRYNSPGYSRNGSPWLMQEIVTDRDGFAAFTGFDSQNVPVLCLYNNTQLVRIVSGVGRGVALAIDRNSQLLYMPSVLNLTVLEAYTYSGVLHHTLPVPNASVDPFTQLLYFDDEAGGRLAQCDTAGHILLITLADGSVTPVLRLNDSDLLLYRCAFTADRSLLYVLGATVVNNQDIAVIVRLTDGAVLAQLVSYSRFPGPIALDSTNAPWMPVWGEGLFVFPPLAGPAASTVDSSSDSLSKGQVAGIVIGCVLSAALMLALGAYVLRRLRRREAPASSFSEGRRREEESTRKWERSRDLDDKAEGE